MTLQPVVFDASTLILLAKVDLLQIMARKVEIHIPRVVEKEALAKPDLYDAQLIARMIKEGDIQVSDAVESAGVKAIQKQFRLAEGEATALSMAKDKQCALGIDDGPGIRAAKIMGVPFLTAVQVLVGLSEQGQVDKPSALAKLDSLAIWGRYGGALVGDARLKIDKGG
jgi:predicted nucleic acid-binding protein